METKMEMAKINLKEELKEIEAAISRMEKEIGILKGNADMIKMALEAIDSMKPVVTGKATFKVEDILPKAGESLLKGKYNKIKQPVFTRENPCVVRIDKDGVETGRWLSQGKAAAECGLNQTTLSYAMRKVSQDRQIKKWGCYFKWQR